MGDRRPSLIDQMAMAAALEGLVDDSEHDDDDDMHVLDEAELEDDEDSHSSLGNDVSEDFLVRGGRTSGSRISGASYSSLSSTSSGMRQAAAAAVEAARVSYLGHRYSRTSIDPMIYEYGEEEDEGEYYDDSFNRGEIAAEDSQIEVGQYGSSNEFILDADIVAGSKDEYESEVVGAMLKKYPVPGLHRASNDGHNHNEHSMYESYDQSVQSGEYPGYDQPGVRRGLNNYAKPAMHSNRTGNDSSLSDIGSAPSRVDSETFDHFDDEQLLDERLSKVAVLSPGATSDSKPTGKTPSSTFDARRRLSFNQKRRTSYNSNNSDHSFHSAPSLYGYEQAEGGAKSAERRRPLSIAVPNAEGAGYARRVSNRSSIRRQPLASVGTTSSTSESFEVNQRRASYNATYEDESGNGQSPGNSGSISSAVSRLTFRNRRSRQTRLSMSIAGRQGPIGSLDSAIDTLRNQDSNSEWENVAAAVTVVAASESGASASNSRHIKFAVNDTVLVFLTLLNVTNMEDPKDTFTVAPVNKYGFPAGEGRTEAEKTGPYTFVICTVSHVHFDEDDRYYTVERADTGTQQRADSGWIEPLTDPEGIAAAFMAARKTVRSTQDKPEEVMEETGLFQGCMDTCLDILSWPSDFVASTLLPFYRRLRLATKLLVTQLLLGEAPFSCKIRITGINVLVLCSIIFLFLEVIKLAFLPAEFDDEIAIVGTVVWIVLALELIFEIMIRPSNYYQLIRSDKAFAPSTARYISNFHLVFESLALLTYIPEFACIGDPESCTRKAFFSRVKASADAILGPTHGDAAWGRLILGLTSLRFFGVIRHWKQMWINNTFHPTKREGIEKWLFPREKDYHESARPHPIRSRLLSKKRDDDDTTYDDDTTTIVTYSSKTTRSEEDQRLKNAATVGTALMVVNSQRALILMVLVVTILPLLNAINQQNLVADSVTKLLQANNLAALSGISDCEYMEFAIESWLNMAIVPQPPSKIREINHSFVLWAQVLPVRCPFQNITGVITSCRGPLSKYREMPENKPTCDIWDTFSPATSEEASVEYFAEALKLREGGIVKKTAESSGDTLSGFNVTVVYNENPTISLANMGLFYLLLSILVLGLYFLQALRGDAIRLVLDPLQRMLKIVLRYAENPLSQDVNKKSQQEKMEDESAFENEGEEIGNFETEQLINAITKIADLLRKCWGVAGAGIISSNLARTKDGKTVVFNPTVPGKRVYALFGFVAINGFSEILRALDRDIMILINDVAKVVHDEVYRWALGEHGQCNKNLGPAFLMVWRIGDFSEVHKKKQVATEKLFRDNATKHHKKSTLRRRYRGVGRGQYGRRSRNEPSSREIQLESLPGIQAFTDRALLGMLKSFAGIHRDKRLTNWKNDFRLSAGVGAYHADIMYGMDAGWAVEGAVGSEYKIDATYLSPHVNMASRMMSATKQYGVTILLSKAVEKLLSKNCRKKLRHLDTVYVKGSKVKQSIFTYDARFQGVDFFLLERTPEQADLESELYTPNIWDQDQDLRAMRQHVSEAFMETYHLAVKQYLGGNWQEAYNSFQAADSIMIEKVLEDGYLEIDIDEMEGRIFDREDVEEDVVRLRNKLGDGACRTLMNFMRRRRLTPPSDWDSVRQLFSK
ncbi:adenylate cyclase family protein [Nitzschia inconspicua]|uniref:Adenylate cyclase family protein n=1 Tax=Nitzschia inconspicua TaxID=303405 RepID=A0A9K3KTP1_9STRA|nr:adenylate cyclase family protein [Nitzschia inconspicua]